MRTAQSAELTLRVHALHKGYGAATRPILTGVSLRIEPGEIVGLVGRSGCGKSTLARCIAGLETVDSGALLLGTEPLLAKRNRALRRRIQYVWQEPQSALSPWLTALQAVAEPLEGYALVPPAQRMAVAAQALAEMGLKSEVMTRRPDALSGGQCQRVALARSLVVGPDVLLLDEPFSALDTVTTVQMLRQLQARLQRVPMAVLFISHDRDAVRRLCQRSLQLVDGQLLHQPV